MRTETLVRIVDKSVTRTLRLDRKLDDAISRRAAYEHISVNFLVNRCLQKYLEWDIPSDEFGMVSVSRDLIRKLFRGLDDERIDHIGRENAREYFKTVTETLGGEFTEASAIDLIKRVGVHGRRFDFNIEEAHDGLPRRLVIRHDDGLPISKFYAAMADEMFHLLNKEAKIATTESLCVIVVGPQNR